jgi:hypothetical protein
MHNLPAAPQKPLQTAIILAGRLGSVTVERLASHTGSTLETARDTLADLVRHGTAQWTDHHTVTLAHREGAKSNSKGGDSLVDQRPVNDAAAPDPPGDPPASPEPDPLPDPAPNAPGRRRSGFRGKPGWDAAAERERRAEAGEVRGLRVIPADWPELPPNASLQAEVAWVQSQRLLVVEQREGYAVVRLELAQLPAPSQGALGWLETSIRSYAKFVDITARATAGLQEEQDHVRRERMALEEIDALLREMQDMGRHNA